MRIMTKLMLQMLLVVILMAAILGTGSYLVTSNSMQKQIKTSVQTEARLRAEQIQLKLDKLTAITGIMAQTEDVKALVGDLSGDEALLNKTMMFFDQVVADNNGTIEMALLIDQNGDTVLSNESTDLDINIKERAYFQQMMETKAVVVSDVVISKSSNLPVVVVAMPVLSGDDVAGAVLATVKFEEISSIVKAVKIGDSGYGYMADLSGLVLSHKKPENEMKMNLNDVAATNPDFKVFLAKMMAQPSGDGMYTYQGIKKYVAFDKVGNWIIALTADEKDYLQPVYKIRTLTVLIAGIISLLAIAFTYIFSRVVIATPLNKLKFAMAKAGEGNLTVALAVRGKDEIAQASHAYLEMINKQQILIKEMQETSAELNQMAAELTASSEEVTATSEEITASISIIANQTEAQVNVTQAAAADMVTLNEGIMTSAALVSDALAASKSCTEEAASSRESLETSLVSMSSIHAVTNTTVTKLHDLGTQASVVSNVSEIIKQIASQISLLALNASIEAARAGEHGRGFSVVADEVRKLAEQTTHESTQITESLAGIQKTVSEASTIVDQMQVEVDSGSQKIIETKDALEKLYYGVESMIALNEAVLFANQGECDIVVKVEAQMKEIEEMASLIASSTQCIMAGAEEQSAITESLTQVAQETSGMAEEMMDAVSKFIV